MANINLISERRQDRLRFRMILKGMAAAMLLVAAIGLGSFSYLATMVVLARGETARQQKSLDAIKPELDEIRKAEAERNQLQPKLTTLGQAQAFTGRWHGILEGLKRATPAETWLTNFTVDGNEGGYNVKLNGVTSNQARVGETMLRLTAQPEYYQRVNLGYTQATQIDLIPTVEFELTAEVTPVGEPAPPAGASNATAGN